MEKKLSPSPRRLTPLPKTLEDALEQYLSDPDNCDWVEKAMPYEDGRPTPPAEKSYPSPSYISPQRSKSQAISYELAGVLDSRHKKTLPWRSDKYRNVSDRTLRGLRPRGSQPTVPGWINGKKADPLGDSGASHNYVSEAYARRNGYSIDQSGGDSVKLANSTFANVVGNTTLSFRFKHDAKVYDLQFKVLRNCIHDVVLGASFLRLTETFTRFKERIKWTLGNIFRPSVNLMDDGAPQQYIRGLCNGTPVVALPDTGCQAQLMSEGHAKAMGYRVLRGARHKIKLELADGSIVYTEGMVENVDWSYEEYGEIFRENFYILKNLACDVILSCDFVCDTQALEIYSHLLFDSNLMDAETQANLNIIKIVAEAEPNRRSAIFKTGLGSIFSRSRAKSAASGLSPASASTDTFEKAREALLDSMEDVGNESSEKQAARKQALEAEYREQMRKHSSLMSQASGRNSRQAS